MRYSSIAAHVPDSIKFLRLVAEPRCRKRHKIEIDFGLAIQNECVLTRTDFTNTPGPGEICVIVEIEEGFPLYGFDGAELFDLEFSQCVEVVHLAKAFNRY